MTANTYLPFPSKVLEIIKHTSIEYTFRMAYDKGDVKPGQFFEVSIPRFGEAPISVSGINKDSIDFTIRKVGKVTNEIFENYVGDTIFLRGPYGNGFDVENYRGKELIVITSGTGLSPVRGLVDYYACHPQERRQMTLLSGFKYEHDILFREDLKRWAETMTVRLSLTRETVEPYENGRVNQHIPSLAIENPEEAIAVIVGTSGMMHTCAEEMVKRGLKEENIWISEERKMCCGIGKCGHCRIGETYICLDGPVFNYVKGKTLVD